MSIIETDITAMDGIHEVKDGDIIVSPAHGGYAVFRWRVGRNQAALGFTQDHDEAMEMARGRQGKVSP